MVCVFVSKFKLMPVVRLWSHFEHRSQFSYPNFAMAFALIFTTNPPVADFLMKTELKDQGKWADGAKRKVKRPSWNSCEGEILSIGELIRQLFVRK